MTKEQAKKIKIGDYVLAYKDSSDEWIKRRINKTYLELVNEFPNDYKLINTIKDRLLIETQDLANKINKLNLFMASADFINLEREDKDLLYEQQRAMSVYLQILGKRLERFDTKFTHSK